MPQTATIKSLPEAFEVVKAMQTDGLDWGEGYRPLGRRALAEIIEGRMAEDVDRWLDNLDGAAASDRRNGAYRRNLLSELGDIELKVPRTRRYCPVSVIRSYARRAPEIDRVILAGFVLGLSTRKVGETLLSLLGRPIAPTTVSRVTKTLDAAVEAFHRRPFSYKALMFDGVVLSRKTGAGALKRPVLVVLGLRPDGRKEIVDYRLARAESAAEWERFLDDLYARGLTGEGLEMICVDGGQGLLAALPTAYHGIPVQRCWAHKIRNVLDKVRKADQDAVKQDLHAVMNADNHTEAPERRQALRRPLGRCIPQGRRMPARRSRRSADLFPLQGPRSTQAGQNHQRYRAPVPRGPAKNTPHGGFPGPHLDGSHPVRYLHPRKQTAGNQYPFPADT